MSNSLAIAAVTTTLRHLLLKGLDIKEVTVRPLDNARRGITDDQVNLFLYQALPDAAWRNMDMPRQVKPGETSQPPLPLTLYYLLTAYSDDDDDIDSHRLLGKAMSILHDHSLLGSKEIKEASESTPRLSGSNLHEQIERVRITLQPLTLEEMSKLWSPFQTQYRFSVAYQVSVVLIESTRPMKTPLPILKRGTENDGVKSQAELLPPFPTLTKVLLPDNHPHARIGDGAAIPADILTIIGHHLEGDSVSARFKHPLWNDAIDVPILPGNTATEIKVQLPDESDKWPVGFYSLAVIIKRAGEPERSTNQLMFSLASRLLNISPNPAARNNEGKVTLTLTCRPEIWPEQRVVLLLGDREILAQPHPKQTDSVKFIVPEATPGQYFLRLRIEGIDSLIVKDYTAKSPVFDPNQRVEIR